MKVVKTRRRSSFASEEVAHPTALADIFPGELCSRETKSRELEAESHPHIRPFKMYQSHHNFQERAKVRKALKIRKGSGSEFRARYQSF